MPEPAALRRPRLLRRLEASSHVVVWAAPGAGKSTLLDQWQPADGVTTIVRDHDASVIRAALADASLGTLAVDDVDRLDDATRALLGDALAADAGPRLVLTGRVDPFPPSPQRWLRAIPLTTADLAFTPGECAEVLRGAGVALTGAQQGTAATVTEGWPPAVVYLRQLLAAGLEPDDALARLMAVPAELGDYLERDVLGSLDPGDRDLLAVCAVDRRISAGLAVAVSERSDAGAVLERIASTGLLRREPGGDFRFLSVLQPFLSERLRVIDPERHRVVHRRAARVLAADGDVARALAHAVSAEDEDAVSQIVESHGLELALRGVPVLRAAVEELEHTRPAVGAPVLLLLDAPFFPRRDASRRRIAQLADGTFADLLRTLWEDAGGADRRPHPPPEPADEAEELFAAYVRGRHDAMCAERDADRSAAVDALRLLATRAGDRGYPWLAVLTADALLTLTLGTPLWPTIDYAVRTVAELAAAAHVFPSIVADRLLVFEAALAYQRCGEVPLAALQALTARGAADADIRRRARTVALVAELGPAPSPSEITHLDHFVSTEGERDRAVVAFALPPRLSAAIAHGNRPLLERIAWQTERACGADSLEAILAAFLLAPDRNAERELRTALADGAMSHDPMTAIHSHVRLAVYGAARGASARARESLLTAVQAVDTTRFIRAFALFGGDALPLLRREGSGLGAWSAVAERIVDASAHVLPPPASAVGTLSVAERSLLSELPVHRSIADIARRRHVSPNTIKTQLRLLYRKLGVSSRAEAVDAARAAGLLF